MLTLPHGEAGLTLRPSEKIACRFAPFPQSLETLMTLSPISRTTFP